MSAWRQEERSIRLLPAVSARKIAPNGLTVGLAEIDGQPLATLNPMLDLHLAALEVDIPKP